MSSFGSDHVRSPSADDDVASPVATGVEVVYETQRWFPFAGWGVKRMPTDIPVWVDAERQGLNRERVRLPEGSQWTSSWTVDEENGDSDGWEYAGDWWWTYHTPQKKQDCVRKRRWVRAHRVADPKPPPFEVEIKSDRRLMDTGVHVNPATLVLTGVVPDTPADLAGASRMIGNTILTVNGAKINDIETLERVPPRDDVLFSIDFERTGGTGSAVHKLFPNTLPLTETLVNTFKCSLREGGVPKPGKLYLTQHYACFWSMVVDKVVIPFSKVTAVELKQGKVFDGVMVAQGTREYYFTGFGSGSSAYKLLAKLWELSTELEASMSQSPVPTAAAVVAVLDVGESDGESTNKSFNLNRSVNTNDSVTSAPGVANAVSFTNVQSGGTDENSPVPCVGSSLPHYVHSASAGSLEAPSGADAAASTSEDLGALVNTTVVSGLSSSHDTPVLEAKEPPPVTPGEDDDLDDDALLGQDMPPASAEAEEPSPSAKPKPKVKSLVRAAKEKLGEDTAALPPVLDEAPIAALDAEPTPVATVLSPLARSLRNVARSITPPATRSPTSSSRGQLLSPGPQPKLEQKGSRLRNVFRRASDGGGEHGSGRNRTPPSASAPVGDLSPPVEKKKEEEKAHPQQPDEKEKKKEKEKRKKGEAMRQPATPDSAQHSPSSPLPAPRDKSAEATWGSNEKLAELKKLFPVSTLVAGEQLVETFSSSYKAKNKIDRVGTMWLTDRRILFTSAFIENFQIPLKRITSMEKKKDLVFLSAIVIKTKRDAFTFTAFISRDAAFKLLTQLWQVRKGTGQEDDQDTEAELAPPARDEGDALASSVSSVGARKSTPSATLGLHAAKSVGEASDAVQKLYPSQGEGKAAVPFQPLQAVLSADAVIKIVENAPLPAGVALPDVFDVLFSDVSTFLSDYHHKRGEYSGTKEAQRRPDIPAWTEGHATTGTGARFYQCTTIVQAPWSTHTPILESQRYVHFADSDTPRLLVQMTSQTPEVTFGTCFRIEVVVSVVDKGAQCFMDIVGLVHFVSTPFGVKGKITNTATSELKTSYTQFLKQAKALLAKGRQGPKPAAGTDAGAAGSADDADRDAEGVEEAATPAPAEGGGGGLAALAGPVIEAVMETDPAAVGQGAVVLAGAYALWSAWSLFGTLQASASTLSTVASELHALQRCAADETCRGSLPTDIAAPPVGNAFFHSTQNSAAALTALQLSILSNLFVSVVLGFACCLAVLACLRK